MPARMLLSVLLPAPFSPQMAWHDPGATSKPTSLSATTPGKRLVMPTNRTAGAAIVLIGQREILGIDVGKAPSFELTRPRPEVLLADPDQLHLDVRRDFFLAVDVINDGPDRHVAPEIGRLGEQDGREPLLDVRQFCRQPIDRDDLDFGVEV